MINIKSAIISILIIFNIPEVASIFPSCFIQSIPKLHAIAPKSSISIKMTSQNRTKTNHSNVFKMDFSEETEEEWLFKPRYAFGLSEFQLIFIRIYIYTYILVSIITTTMLTK